MKRERFPELLMNLNVRGKVTDSRKVFGKLVRFLSKTKKRGWCACRLRGGGVGGLGFLRSMRGSETASAVKSVLLF